jgi:cobyrinic acid a,c-diamide synthase
MTPNRIAALAQGAQPQQDSTLIIEGAMGLFDGAPSLDPLRDGKGACADLARHLNIPVVLVVDAGRMAQSIAPLVAGFMAHDATVRIAGIILNNVGSDRHRDMLMRALAPLGVAVFGAVPRSRAIHHPDRHLGLVQAREHSDLDQFLETAADVIDAHVNIFALMECATTLTATSAMTAPRTAPPAQTIAVAQDDAFAFTYPHLLQDWRDQGAEITIFSPLLDQAPPLADLTYLPGGYPELHAERLSNNLHFMQGLRMSAAQGSVYGECGGFMVLGDGMIDAKGQRHKMAGLLALETSFQTRKLHLGYRAVHGNTGPFKGDWTAHEFHYATTLKAAGDPLFTARDAMDADLGATGLVKRSVSGSFMHLIDAA